MVKFYETSITYDYSFPAVALAYFLRYPNPYSTHVLSTDVITRTFDPSTQQLHTVRLHLKRSKLPAALLRILPRSILGASAASGDSQSYILERSTVDVRNGTLETEARNLEWTGVLSVVERQRYCAREPWRAVGEKEREREGDEAERGESSSSGSSKKTDVTSTVQLLSRVGQSRRKRARTRSEDGSDAAAAVDDAPPKLGFFRSWSTSSLQRSIELIGLKRAQGSQPKATEGMKVVLERLRRGGLVAVLEGMRRDGEATRQLQGPWKRLRETEGLVDQDEWSDG